MAEAPRKPRWGMVGIAGALLVAAAVVAVVAMGGGAAPPAGDPAPDIAFQYFDGTTGSFADFEGKPLVVNFWASWCPACIAEMPDFQAVHEQFGERVAFLGIDMQEVNRQAALELVEKTGVQYVLADDPKGDVYNAFGGFAMPTTIFIDENGFVVDRQNGAIFRDDLAAKIDAAFFDR